jgi:hypothetical protein
MKYFVFSVVDDVDDVVVQHHVYRLTYVCVWMLFPDERVWLLLNHLHVVVVAFLLKFRAITQPLPEEG